MNSSAITGAISGMVGGFFMVAVVYLLTNKSSNAPKLITESFGGFAKTLNVAMGGKGGM
jgi:hypothetical protein